MKLLSELVGRKVTIYSEQGESERQDVVVIEDADGEWIRTRKSDVEVLYFNTRLVRMIKPFDAH